MGEITLPNGKKKTKYAKDQSAIKSWLTDQRKAIKDGSVVLDESYTLGQFLKRYLDEIAKNTLAPRTFLAYESVIRVHIIPGIGNLQLTKIRPEHLQRFYAEKLDSGLSRRTVQRVHQIIYTNLQRAYKWGLVMRNVADLVSPPKAEDTIPVIFDVKQVNTLLNAVKDTKYHALYACAASLGLREGELLGLNWKDIDFENSTIRIDKQLQYIPHKGFIIKTPKTKNSIRTLPLPEVALKALKQHRSFSNSPVVFTSENGTYYYPRNILRHFQKLSTKLGLPVIPFHNLRHSCASYHLAAGTNPKIVQFLLGHSTVAFTLHKYSHLLKGVSEEATKNIDKIFDTA